MKSKIKKMLGLFVFCAAVIPFTNVSAATTVNNEEELIAALSGADNEINLGANITTTAPIEVSKDVTINGQGFTITAGYTGTDGNKTILASTTTGTLTLKNMTISNSPKYGVQAHNGGSVVLDGVTIQNSGYGAALANGGTITVKNLVLINNNYGIEFGVGNQVTGTPSLIMDGTIDFTKQTKGDKLYVALEDPITAVSVENTEASAQKIYFDGTNIVLTNNNGDVVATSNAITEGVNVDITGAEAVRPETTTPDTTPTTDNNTEEVKKEEMKNPETSDNILVYGVLALAGLGAITVTSRKLLKH